MLGSRGPVQLYLDTGWPRVLPEGLGAGHSCVSCHSHRTLPVWHWAVGVACRHVLFRHHQNF